MNIHKLTIPTGMPVGPVNLYLIEGEPLTLIDVGPNTTLALQTLERELIARGFAWRDIQRIIITHTHPDHYGLAREVAERSGATVWTHPINAEWFNDLERAMMRRGLFTMQVYQQAGVPSELMDSFMRQGVRMGRKMFEATPVNHWLSDGDTLEMGGATWTVLHTPGHAQGHIVFYEPLSRQMIVADHLLKHITPNPMMEAPLKEGEARPKSLVQYLESLKRIEALEVSIAYPGHGENISDHRGLIAAQRIFHEARLERILGLLDGQRRTAYELMRELFPNLTDFEIFLGLSEVIGHLDILLMEGRVREEEREGVVWYWKS